MHFTYALWGILSHIRLNFSRNFNILTSTKLPYENFLFNFESSYFLSCQGGFFSGLGTVFFCVLSASFFCVPLNNATFSSVLFRVFSDLWDPKERCVLCILFLRTKKNAKNVKERKKRNVLRQKNAKERRMLRSLEKNACPTLVLFLNIYL